MTIKFTPVELAEVLGAALLGAEDDEPPNVTVRLGDGELDVTGALWVPMLNVLQITAGSTLNRTTRAHTLAERMSQLHDGQHWLDDVGSITVSPLLDVRRRRR